MNHPVEISSLRPRHVSVLGCCAVCAQAIYIREALALFTGTELVLGILLAAWLFWVAAGGMLGWRFGRRMRMDMRTRFNALAMTAAVMLPLSVMAIRAGRGILAEPPGELPPFAPAVIFSVLVVGPFAFVYGALYNVASELWKAPDGGLRRGVSRVYIWEAAGALGGAVLFSFVLVNVLSQLGAAFSVAFLVIAVVLAPASRRELSPVRAGAIAVTAAVFILLSPMLDGKSVERIYPGYRIEQFRSSRYGEIVAASRNGAVSLFYGGGRILTVPEPERAEEIVHIPLLAHPSPESVLCIGGVIGGIGEEIMKHPTVRRADLLEMDPVLFELAGSVLGEETSFSREAGGPGGAVSGDGVQVRFVEADGRFFLSSGRKKYDVIIIGAPPPINLQYNRYFTAEFFRLVRRSLGPGGIFSLSHPSSENFLSPGQARVLSSLRETFVSVFGDVTLVPGSTVHFIAGAESFGADTLIARLDRRGIETRFINENFLPFRVSPERVAFLASRLEQAGAAGINTDRKPVLPLYELILEGGRVGSGMIAGFDRCIDLDPAAAALVLGAVLIIIFLAARGRGAAQASVWAVGFCSFLLQLLVLLAYQSYSGLLYHAIVLMTALFMGGAALGAVAGRRSGGSGKVSPRLVHAGFIVISLALIGWSAAAARIHPPLAAGTIVFLGFAALNGFLTGVYYPIVVGRALPEDGSRAPASFYAWDLIGACTGGLIGGVVLFPVMGLFGTALLVAAIHAAAAVMVAGRW